jgi:ATP-dependent Clp protease adaptor protein ClpS
MNIFNQTETEEEVLIEVVSDEQYQLVVFNDDVNTFDHVIHALMTICKHEWIQAEQCALLVHTTGKTVVKSGPYKEMVSMCTALLDRSITAEIEKKYACRTPAWIRF